MANPHKSYSRKQVIEFYTVFVIVTIFLLFLFVSFGGIVGAILVILCAIVFLGAMRGKRPELFPAPKPPEENGVIERPCEPAPVTYLMLIDLSGADHESIRVDASPFMIGRADFANHCIQEPGVSRKHLLIEYDRQNDRRYIMDCSRFGSFLNSERLAKGEKTPVHHGDMLKIGENTFSVEYVNTDNPVINR